MQTRNYYFDNLKYILILLVIWGHALEEGMASPLNKAMVNFLYLFHMPLFVFVSGYFTHIKERGRYFHSLLRILETYLLLQAVFLLHDMIVQGGPYPVLKLIRPRFSAWYLLCLVYWRVGIYYAQPVLKSVSPAVLLSLSLVLSLLAGFVPIGAPLAFQRTFVFLPFFLLGYYLGQRPERAMAFVSRGQGSKWTMLGAMVVLAICLLATGWMHFSHDLPQERLSYFEMPEPTIWLLAFRLAHTFVAVLISACFMLLIPRGEKWFSKYGKETLFFYIWHSLVVFFLIKPFVHNFSFTATEVLVYPTLSAIVLVVLMHILLKIPVCSFLLNPFTRLYDAAQARKSRA